MPVKNLILILLAFNMDATDTDNNVWSQAFSAAGSKRGKQIGIMVLQPGKTK